MDIVEELAGYSNDPLGWVLWAFPWGEPGELVNAKIEPWQYKFLDEVGKELRAKSLSVHQIIQRATTSGHGIGKSALVAWLLLWGISTFEDTIGVVTANTETQLKTKTWVQLAIWHRRSVIKDLFKMTATKLYAADPTRENSWRIDMVPWSERNTEAFAGLHNQGKRIILVFDEASAIPDMIWEVAEGALTDLNTQILWIVFGNPTRNTGRFKECFPPGKFSHRWDSAVVDSREVSFVNQERIDAWISDYGNDSDFVRVRVLGKFPRVDSESFISREIADEATKRIIEPQLGFPILIGADVGRFGDDPSVIYFRKGRDGRTIPPEIYYSIDTMTFVRKIMEAVLRTGAAMAFVDEGGVGGGVVDRLRQLRVPVMGVDFGSKADGNAGERGVKYANKRAEIWGAMRDWLMYGTIPERIQGHERSLVDELIGPNYGMNAKEEILLENKKEMRRRGEASPNTADALAVTFSMPVFEPSFIDLKAEQPFVAADYNPFEHERIYGEQRWVQ